MGAGEEARRFPRGNDVGMAPGPADYMTIVGFPGGTSYELYSQTTRANAVVDVAKIFG